MCCSFQTDDACTDAAQLLCMHCCPDRDSSQSEKLQILHACMSQAWNAHQICKGVCRQDANEGKSAAALLEPSSSDKWLASLRKSVSRALADFSRAATRGLLRILRSRSFSSNQARPGDTSHPPILFASALHAYKNGSCAACKNESGLYLCPITDVHLMPRKS